MNMHYKNIKPTKQYHSSDDLFGAGVSKKSTRKRKGGFGKWWKKRSLKQKLGLVVMLVVVVGMGAGVYAQLFTDFDIRQMAWGGVEVSQDFFQQYGGADQGSLVDDAKDPNRVVDPNSQEGRFNALLVKYPDADTATISVSEFAVSGIVLNAYDDSRDVTYVYALFENLPSITGFEPSYWVKDKAARLSTKVVGERVKGFPPQDYFVGEIAGSISSYDTLVFSYDPKSGSSGPEVTFVTLEFNETGGGGN